MTLAPCNIGSAATTTSPRAQAAQASTVTLVTVTDTAAAASPRAGLAVPVNWAPAASAEAAP
jgi:hypothetical protein